MEDLRKEHFPYLPWILCGLAGLFYFYAYLLRVIPGVMTSQLLVTYQLNAASFGNLTGAYYYIYMPMQLAVGILLDRYNPRLLLAMALMGCGLGSYLFGNAENLGTAYLGRFLVGFGSAFAFVGALKMACLWLPTNQFTFITGVTTALGMLGGIVGDTLLTTLVNHQGWRLANYSVAASGIILGLLMLLMHSRKRHSNENNPPKHVSSLREGFRGLWELLRNPQMWINCVIGCLLFIPLSGFADSWGISYLMAVYHLPKSVAAGTMSLMYLGWLSGAPFIGWISDGVKSRRMPLTVGATFSAILLSVILYVPNLNYNLLLLSLFFLGLFASTQIIVFSVSRELSPNPLTATAVALTNTIVAFSGVSVSLVGVLLNLSWQDYAINRISIYAWHYQLALAILPLSLICAVFLTFYLDDTNCRRVLSVEKETAYDSSN